MAAPGPPGTVPLPAADLQEELDAIVDRLRAEIRGALDRWKAAPGAAGSLTLTAGSLSLTGGLTRKVSGGSQASDCLDILSPCGPTLTASSRQSGTGGAGRCMPTSANTPQAWEQKPPAHEPEALQVVPATPPSKPDGGASVGRKSGSNLWKDTAARARKRGVVSPNLAGDGTGISETEGSEVDATGVPSTVPAPGARGQTATPSSGGASGKFAMIAAATVRNTRKEKEQAEGGGRFGKSKRMRSLKTTKADSFLFSDTRAEALATQTMLQRVTRHKFFEWATGLLILANSIFIGVSAQYNALDGWKRAQVGLPPSQSEPAAMKVFQVIFTLLFSLELGVRWTAEGILGFFRTDDISWNIFDVLVVTFGILDLISSSTDMGNSGVMQNTSILRVMRVVRVVRVARVIRIMRFFRELRMMIVALLGSFKSLLWVCIILMMLFFMFGISLTSGVTDLMNETAGWAKEENQDLISAFGTLEASILTLYMSMSGGMDWGDAYDLLGALSVTHRIFFLVFVSFAIFAVVNIVTGVFVDTALQCNQSDKETLVQEEMAAQNRYLSRMRQVFEEMDADAAGSISMEEFERKLSDDRVIAYFSALKLDVSDAKKLFMLLDYDQSGEIGLDEFLSGCDKLRGESRALDMAIMMYEINWLREALMNLQEYCEQGFKDVLVKVTDRGHARSSLT